MKIEHRSENDVNAISSRDFLVLGVNSRLLKGSSRVSA
jgi:hypothetical protein